MKRAAFAVLAFAIAVLSSARADAYERQWHAGATFGYTYLAGPDAGYHGLGGALQLQYGITDAFNFIGEIGATAHPAGKLVVPTASAGIVYVIDILSVVPWVGATAGAGDIWLTGACGGDSNVPCHHGKLALGVPFGLDYQLSRSFALGVQGKYQLFLIGDSPLHAIGGFAHAEFIWGY